MSDKESQQDEICVLKSIYNEEELQIQEDNSLLGGQFYAFIEPPADFKVIFKDLRLEESVCQELHVKYLPPLSVQFGLPKDYPSHSPPTYKLFCQWLQINKIMELRKRLDSIWKENEGTEVLFLWTQFLKEETLKYLQMTDVLDISDLETTYLSNEEQKQARRRARQLQVQERIEREKMKEKANVQKEVKEEKCDTAKASAAQVKEVNVPSGRPFVVEYSRGKFRGRRPRWGRRDRVTAFDSQKGDVSESTRSETSTYITSNANNERPSRGFRGSYRGYNGKGRNSSYHKSVGRGNDSCRSDSQEHGEIVFSNEEVPDKNNTNYDTSQQRNHKKTEAVSLSGSSSDTVLDHQKKNSVTKECATSKTETSINRFSDRHRNRASSYREYYGRGYKARLEGRGNTNSDSSRSDSLKSHNKVLINNSEDGTVSEKKLGSSNCDTLEKQISKRSDTLSSTSSSESSVDYQKNCIQNANESVETINVDKDSDNQLTRFSMKDGARSNSSVPRMSVMQLLKEFNEARQRTEFTRNFYSCKICFQDKQGAQCTRFEGCGHVFCKCCVAEYFEVQIREGSVKNICCPEEKCNSEAMPGQVRELVSPETFARYDSVLLSVLLDTMEDMLYCPRPACQYPVALEPGEKMATCPACAYVFCIYCKMVYHGIEPCRFRSHEKRRLVEEYNNANDERKVKLEMRYGKKQLQMLVETSLSESWLVDNSKKCPTCNAHIEKSDGCNKMVCWKCNTSFCWLCETRLNPQQPYQHFNNPASKCNNLLFHGVPLSDDDDDDIWGPPGLFLRDESDNDDD